MRWAVGLTLRPGRSYLEATVRVINRTPVVNTMLAWANVAVHTNDNYQVIFPPSTQFGTHHAKREFIRWPIADSRYGGSDFSKGVDVSMMKNHMFGNSIFAWNYEDDFLAGYDHGKQAGTMSIADHHVVPGKKVWTWGNGPGGRLWDRILTDTDGPYIELMVGAYSDNQPDYSWVQPFEAKDFKQFWYPFRNIGGAKNANLDAAVNLDIEKGTAKVGFYTTAPHTAAVVRVKAGEKVVLEETVAIAPDKPFAKQVSLPAGIEQHQVRASLSAGGRELVAYTPVKLVKQDPPKPVTPPAAPKDIRTNEELYLAGLRLDQFHNPGLEPEPYWEEALKRDPSDARVNTAYGIRLLKRGRFEEAEKHFRAALARVTNNYTRPYDGDSYYYLGVTLKEQGRLDQAFDNLYAATWSAAWQSPAYFGLAEIAAMRGQFDAALQFADRSVRGNGFNTRALGLKAAVLRHLGRTADAAAVAAEIDRIDPLDVRGDAEVWLSQSKPGALFDILREHPSTGLELAVEYGNAGLWKDAMSIASKLEASAMPLYYLGYYAEKMGDQAQAHEYFRKASAASPELVFPFQYEAIAVLRKAMAANPKDARAPYYLGNLLFDWQPAEAVRLWEQASALDPSFPIAHRNLAMAYARQDNALDKAIASLEKAISTGKHPIHFFELDQLYEAAGAAPEKRLAVLEKHHELVTQRDDALAREIAMKVNMGKYDEAIKLMTGRRFNVWEGGARFSVHDNWTDAHLLRGCERLASGNAKEALDSFKLALEFPSTLQVARFRTGGRYPEANYWMGVAYDALGDKANAQQAWKEASRNVPNVGNDDILPTTDRTLLLYYQALSLQKLGESDRAAALFKSLIRSGDGELKEKKTVDFFAKFGDQLSENARKAQAHYLRGLGLSGLGDSAKAKTEFAEALKLSPAHLGAKIAAQQVK
jgi:tetratricopeptide (TPR) repeat protein